MNIGKIELSSSVSAKMPRPGSLSRAPFPIEIHLDQNQCAHRAARLERGGKLRMLECLDGGLVKDAWRS